MEIIDKMRRVASGWLSHDDTKNSQSYIDGFIRRAGGMIVVTGKKLPERCDSFIKELIRTGFATLLEK